MRKIDFLGIGAHKCATTWLWYVLRSHEQVWVPHKKEIHYFDRNPEYPSTCELNTSKLVSRLVGLNECDRLWRKTMIFDVAGGVAKLDFQRLRWCWKFYFHDITDDWYVSLFADRAEEIVGEITPSYSMLSVKDITHIRELFPELKIIFLMRDPVVGAWSHIGFDAGLGKINDVEDLEEVKTYLSSPVVTRRGDYVSTINNWQTVFPAEQVFLGFYDDIRKEPTDFLKRLSDFLGIDSAFFPTQSVKKNVGVSQSRPMPGEIRTYLTEKYLEDMEFLSDKLGGASTIWLERAVAHLESNG